MEQASRPGVISGKWWSGAMIITVHWCDIRKGWEFIVSTDTFSFMHEETDKKTVVIKEEANDSAQEQGLAKSLSL